MKKLIECPAGTIFQWVCIYGNGQSYVVWAETKQAAIAEAEQKGGWGKVQWCHRMSGRIFPDRAALARAEGRD